MGGVECSVWCLCVCVMCVVQCVCVFVMCAVDCVCVVPTRAPRLH